MERTTKIGIIICDRYRRCAGGKCFRSLKEKEGAFSIYQNTDLELVGYTSCDGCPGGNVEYAGAEMVKNGAEFIHLATGLVVGYPPCPYIQTFVSFLEKRYPVKVVVGTHPIPPSYLDMHTHLGTFETSPAREYLPIILSDESTRNKYA
jgi:predicted metal-binding protein